MNKMSVIEISDSESGDNNENDNDLRCNMPEIEIKPEKEIKSENEENSYNSEPPEAKNEPLMKVTFRNELIAKKYCRRVKSIINYVLASEKDENYNEPVTNLTLEIYENVSTSHIPTVMKDNIKSEDQLENSSVISNKRKIDDNNQYEGGKKLRMDDLSSNLKIVDTLHNLANIFNISAIGFGNYVYLNKTNDVILTKDYILFFTPLGPGNSDVKILSINCEQIIRIITDFSIPALFFDVTTNAAKKIRKTLNRICIIPNSKDVNQKYIKIVLNTIDEKSKEDFKYLFKTFKIEEYSFNLQSMNLSPIQKIKRDKKKNSPLSNTNNFDISKIDISSQTNMNDTGITLLCRVLKIGSYEYSKKRMCYISTTNIKFFAPAINNDCNLTIDISLEEIVKILVEFANFPILYILITKAAAKKIRNMLGMTDSKGFYIDPKSKVEIQRYITIFPESIQKESAVVQQLIKKGKLEELNQEMAKVMISKVFNQNSQTSEIIPSCTNSSFHPYISSFSIKCINVAIGTYMCELINNFIITKQNFQFTIPEIYGEGVIDIYINFNEVKEVLIHSSAYLNVLFLYVHPECVKTIKKSLHPIYFYYPEMFPISDHQPTKIFATLDVIPRALPSFLKCNPLLNMENIQEISQSTAEALMRNKNISLS